MISVRQRDEMTRQPGREKEGMGEGISDTLNSNKQEEIQKKVSSARLTV